MHSPDRGDTLQLMEVNFIRDMALRMLFILISLGLINACESAAAPKQVADKFWQAALAKDVDAMKRLVIPEQQEHIELDLLDSVERYSLGEMIVKENTASVETNLILKDSGKQLSLNTRLVRVDKDWKVDYKKTASPFVLSREMSELLGGIEQLTEQFADELAESVEEFKNKAVPEIQSKLEQAEKELKKNLPEIKKQIDEFLRDLEESLKQPPSVQEPKTTET